ncbi:hypothetical protein ACFL2I_05140 [Candidatus Omnitrophota bacterium]
MLSRVKTVLLLVFSGGLIFFSFLASETKLANIFTVGFIGGDSILTEFPIPIIFWLGMFVYLVLTAKLLKVRFSNLLGFGLILGFATHFILLLLNTHTRNLNGEIIWYSAAYKLYFKAFLFFFLSILSITSGVLFRLYRRATNLNFIISTYLFTLLLLFTVGSMFRQNDYLFSLAMIVLFLLSFSLSGIQDIYLRIERAFRLFRRIVFDQRVFILLIFISALVFRIFFLTRVMSSANYYETGSDGGYYDYLANRFLAGEYFSMPQNKGYWLFLAGIYHLFGRNYFVVGLIQSILGSLAIVLIYLIAKRAFGVLVARVAAIVSVLNYSLVFSAAAVGHQAMDIFYGLTVVYLLMKTRDVGINRKGALLLALAGIFSALLIVNREINGLLPLVVSGWLGYLFLKSGYKRSEIAGIIGIFFLFFALGIGPFLYLNYTECGSLYDRTSTYSPEWIFTQLSPHLTEMGFSPYADLEGSLKIVTQEPLIFFKAIWLNCYSKFVRLYFSQGYGGFDPIFLVRKPTTNYFLTIWFYAYFLTFIGMISVFMKKTAQMIKDRPVAYLVLSIILYKTLIHMITYGNYRYRAPIEPFLIMFGAYGLYLMARLGRKKAKAL